MSVTIFINLNDKAPKTLQPKISPDLLRKKGCKYLVCAYAVWPNCCSQVSELFSRHSTVASKSLRWERVFCFQNSFGLLWEKNVLVIYKNFCKLSDFSLEFQNFFSITWTIYSNIEESKTIFETDCFLSLFLEISKI